MKIQSYPSPPRIVALGGPVTAAIRAMRADEPATDYARIRQLRRAIEERIEADIALLDALLPDPDMEDTGDAEPSLCGLSVDWPTGFGDDREDGDDTGIADEGGAAEQLGCVWFGCVEELDARDGRPLCCKNGVLVSERFA